MSDDRILTVLADAIRKETGSPSMTIKGDMTASDVPGWDSLAHIRILLDVGATLGISIDIEATYRAATIDDLVLVIKQGS